MKTWTVPGQEECTQQRSWHSMGFMSSARSINCYINLTMVFLLSGRIGSFLCKIGLCLEVNKTVKEIDMTHSWFCVLAHDYVLDNILNR